MQRKACLNKILSLGSAFSLLFGVAHLPVQAQANAPSPAQATAAFLPEFKREGYNPAVLHLQFTPLPEGRTTSSGGDAFLDMTLIPSSGTLEGVRVELTIKEFRNQLRNLYVQLSRQDSLQVQLQNLELYRFQEVGLVLLLYYLNSNLNYFQTLNH